MALARALASLTIAVFASISGCATSFEDARAVRMADEAVRVGDHDRALALLEPYLKRNWLGNLRVRWFSVYNEERESLVSATSALLWETERDTTLLEFSQAYLPRREAEIYRCRVQERRREFYPAYRCWETLGEKQRAQRVQRTEALVQFQEELKAAPIR